MGQGAATRGENDVANNIEPTPVRIPYNNGYGDFFFGCLPKWKKPKITKDMSEGQKLDLIGITGSNGIPVVELGNFQRYAGEYSPLKEVKRMSQQLLDIPNCWNTLLKGLKL
jgi:hypothetical protein